MSIRLTVAAIAATAIVAAFAQPAHADVTFKSQDGVVELTLPNGWHEAKQSGMEAAIHVAAHAVRITVREHPKEDFKDTKAVATYLAERLKKKFTDAEPKFEDVQVNGKPAVRVSLEGTEPSGVRAGYLITVIEAGPMYISVMGTGNASAFAKEKQLLAEAANQLKITPATPAPATAAPQPASAAAAPQQPAAAPPPPATKPRGAH